MVRRMLRSSLLSVSLGFAVAADQYGQKPLTDYSEACPDYTHYAAQPQYVLSCQRFDLYATG